MGEPEETYVINQPGSRQELIEQLNVELLRIAEKIADKSDIGKLVNRGDAATWDFELADFTTDTAWHRLDLSSIVPSDAIMVKLFVRIKDGAIDSYILFRKRGNAYSYNRSELRTQVANQFTSGDIDVFCDSNQVIEYYGSNLTFTKIDVTVKGWVLG